MVRPSPFALFLATLLWAGFVSSQPAEPQPQPQSPQPKTDNTPSAAAQQAGLQESKLSEAKQLFKRGNALRKAGDCQGAVLLYLKSREAVPSVANTQNAAVCLRDLGRADEALEMYEALLVEFAADLGAKRPLVASEMAALRAKVGAVDVIANVSGTLVIDGRVRGKLPLEAPVRVLPGAHQIVVLAEGYAGFRATVEVDARETAAIKASLEVLSEAGRLRIEGPGLDGAEVFIDGAPLGVVPWEGSLDVGAHRYFVRKGDTGSAPQLVNIVNGQTITETATLVPLGPPVRLSVQPPAAALRIGGVDVGAGRWQGRLPLGKHLIEAAEEGYQPLSQTIVIDDKRDQFALELQIDDEHPRWYKPIPGGPWIEVIGGAMFTPSLASSPENIDCGGEDSCSGDTLALGFSAIGRVGYEFPMGLSLEATGGYLQVSRGITRSFSGIIDNEGVLTDINVKITDDLTLSGPFFGVGVSQRFPFADHFEVRLHLMLGMLIASGDDVITTDGKAGEGVNEGGGPNLFLMPELQLGARFGAVGLAAGLATPMFTMADSSHKLTGNLDSQLTPFLNNERTYGTFYAFVPTLGVHYLF